MSNLHSESIGALVIHCIDYRFVSNERKFLEKESLQDNYDLIGYPGASKFIEKLLEAVEVSMRLHNPKKIMIIDHEDCGAFGDQNSREVHKDSLEKAKTFLNSHFPDLKIETYIATFEGVEPL